MKDWRSWAWLSVALIALAMSSCVQYQIKANKELAIKAMENGYEYEPGGLTIKLKEAK